LIVNRFLITENVEICLEKSGLAVTPLVSQEKNAGMTDQRLSKGGSFGN
jgi:hypothetical protein